MESIKKFNGLNGQTVSRAELLHIIHLAKLEEQQHIVKKLTDVLLQNADVDFTLEIINPGIEALPKSMLNGLQLDDINEYDPTGLNKAVSPDEIYKTVTDLILNTIQEVGFLPWQKEWKGSGLPTARNYVTNQPYTGINAVTLPYDTKIVNGKMVLIEPTEKDVYYLTFNQIQNLGATLRKGSKGRMVTYFNFILNYNDLKKDLRYNTVNASDFSNFAKKHKITENDLSENLEKYPILKYYNVFKATDCDNLPEKQPIVVDAKPIEIAEKIIELYPNSPKIVIGKEDRAFYVPSQDNVFMPKIIAFSNESYYYSTFFHELIHSTGHKSRLQRDMSGRFGNADYAFEELVAELGAVFLCAETGILFNTIENSAKYLKGWNSRLVGKMIEDKRFFFKAAAMAQKGANYILDLNDKREPAYRLFFEKQMAKEISKKPTAKKKKAIKPTVEPKPNGQKVAKERPNYSRKRKFVPKPKVDKNGQTALFGAKKGLKSPTEEAGVNTETTVIEEKNIDQVNTETTVLAKVENLPSKKYKTAVDRLTENQAPKQLYNIKGDLAKFLGKIEIKPVQSLAITLDSGEGGGKTHTLYNWANEFFEAGYKPIIWSFEEHATSGLATDKAEHYFGANKGFIPIESENDGETGGETINRMKESIADFDVILIDSWAKVVEMDKAINFDQDLRKKFNGKLFIVVFQRTSSGEIRGGSKAGFDGDVILKVEVDRADFRNNYIYNHKNRYNDYMPISELKYSPYHRELRKTASEKATETPKLSFTAIEI